MSYSSMFLEKYRLLEEESQNKKSGITQEDKQNYENLINTLRKKSYPEAVKYLDDVVKDDKLKFALSLGFGGPLASVKMSSDDTALTCSTLLPTQNEIDVDNSLAYLLYKEEGIGNIPNYFKGSPITVVTAIVTFRNNYVIDGHHRWSQAYCANPKCKITAVNFDSDELSAQQMLKVAQATIASNRGAVPSQTVKGINIYADSTTEDVIRKYISEKMTPNFEEAWKKALANVVKKSGGGELTKDDVVKYLVDNCMLLKANNVPIKGAPERGIMPQTKSGDIADMGKGVTKI